MKNSNLCSFNAHNEQKMTGNPELHSNKNMIKRKVRKSGQEQGGGSLEDGIDIDAYILRSTRRKWLQLVMLQ